MRGMNDGCVDLIYLGPPFNSNRDYAAPIGSEAAGVLMLLAGIVMLQHLSVYSDARSIIRSSCDEA